MQRIGKGFCKVGWVTGTPGAEGLHPATKRQPGEHARCQRSSNATAGAIGPALDRRQRLMNIPCVHA